jgi:hypothetical protein
MMVRYGTTRGLTESDTACLVSALRYGTRILPRVTDSAIAWLMDECNESAFVRGAGPLLSNWQIGCESFLYP